MRHSSVSVLTIFVLVLLGACQNAPAPSPTLKIGVIASQTGVGSYLGQQELKGLQLAADEINAKGGVNGRKIELITEDSRADQAAAVTALSKLVDVDGVKFVIGDSWTTTTFSIVPVANQKGVLLLSPIATLDSLRQDDLFFRTMSVTQDMMIPLADYAYDVLHARRVAILRSDTPFGAEHARDFKEAFEARGGKVVGDEKVDQNAQDVRSELNKLAATQPDTVFNVLAATLEGLGMKQAKELGINVTWLGAVGTETSVLLKNYGSFAEGIVYPYPYDVTSSDPNVQAFIRAYAQKYNETPDNTAANAYDALKVLAAGIEQAGDDPAKVKPVLLSLHDYPGGSGMLSFDENGDVKKQVIIKKVKNGAFVKVTD